MAGGEVGPGLVSVSEGAGLRVLKCIRWRPGEVGKPKGQIGG